MCLYGRKIYVHGRMGVGALRKSYSGSRTTDTTSTARLVRVRWRSGITSYESLGVVEKGGKRRVITASGMRDLDRIAGRVKVDHKMI